MLIIFTSLGHNEIDNYWHWEADKAIVDTNEIQLKRFGFRDDEDGWEAELIDNLLPDNEDNMVLVHESNPNIFDDLKNNLTKARVFRYSTIMDELMKDLWSWDNHYHEFEIPEKEPELPFDKL
ncbi:MAG: hypothetical protein ACOCQ4_03140 [bacterium]